jgi:hypothetical protein
MSTAPRRPFRGRGAPPPGTGYVRRGPAPAPGPADGAKTLRKPVFTTVDQLRPQTHGHTLTARVISARTVLDKPSTHIGRTRVAECLVGDSTGTVLVTARNEQGIAVCDPLCSPSLFFSLAHLSLGLPISPTHRRIDRLLVVDWTTHVVRLQIWRWPYHVLLMLLHVYKYNYNNCYYFFKKVNTHWTSSTCRLHCI